MLATIPKVLGIDIATGKFDAAASAQGPAYAVAREEHNGFRRLVIAGNMVAVAAAVIVNVVSVAVNPPGPLAVIEIAGCAVCLV